MGNHQKGEKAIREIIIITRDKINEDENTKRNRKPSEKFCSALLNSKLMTKINFC